MRGASLQASPPLHPRSHTDTTHKVPSSGPNCKGPRLSHPTHRCHCTKPSPRRPLSKRTPPVSASPRLSSAMCCVLHVHTPLLPPECRASASVVSLPVAPRFDETPFIAQLYHSPFDGRWPLETHTRSCERCPFSRWEGPKREGYARHPCLSGAHAGRLPPSDGGGDGDALRAKGFCSCSVSAAQARDRAGQCGASLRPSARTLPCGPAQPAAATSWCLGRGPSRGCRPIRTSSAGWAKLPPPEQLATLAPLPASA